MKENEKIQLFETAPIPGAVAKLAVPMIFSSGCPDDLQLTCHGAL